MHTFFARHRSARRSTIGRVSTARAGERPRLQSPIDRASRSTVRARGGLPARRPLASEAGDTLLEVIVSALLVGLIVVGVFSGFNASGHVTARERARAQADALAQQAEDRLRDLPLAKLEVLEAKPIVEEITQNGIKYTTTSTAEYHIDSSATSSCNSTSTNAGYYRTSSTVTGAWQSAKSPVVETGIISPPPGSALVVQVTGITGEGVGGMTVTATGPSPSAEEHTLTTVANGCAILALKPGEYTINVHRLGYVDENWYAESVKDPHSVNSVYLTAETSAKESYRFAQAGALEVKFSTESTASVGDSFVASNAEMKSPAFRAIPSPSTLETYSPAITSKVEVFPFVKSKYAVYAGTCEANNPKEVNPPLEPQYVSVLSGEPPAKVTVVEPPINIKVMSGTKALPGKTIEHATVTLTDEDEGCEKVKRSFNTNSKGALPHPGAPFGEYKLCVTGGKEGGNNGATKGLAQNRKYTTGLFEDNTLTGPSKLAELANGGLVEEPAASKVNYAIIYMEGAGSEPGEIC
jgi:type II secretory pathway pseudopilin PulG